TAYQTPSAYADILMPRNSAVAPLIGLFACASAFGLIWHIWWLAIIGFVLVWAVVIASSFNLHNHEIIPAAEVRTQNEAFLEAVRIAPGVSRDDETSAANQGKAVPEQLEKSLASNTRGNMTEATT